MNKSIVDSVKLNFVVNLYKALKNTKYYMFILNENKTSMTLLTDNFYYGSLHCYIQIYL